MCTQGDRADGNRAALSLLRFENVDASFLRTLIDNKLHGSRTVPGSRAGTRPGSPIQGASSLPTNAGPSSANMETLLKHAAGDPSAGLSSNWSANLQSEHFLGLGAEYGDQAFDGLAPDPYGRSDAFWDNVSLFTDGLGPFD